MNHKPINKLKLNKKMVFSYDEDLYTIEHSYDDLVKKRDIVDSKKKEKLFAHSKTSYDVNKIETAVQLLNGKWYYLEKQTGKLFSEHDIYKHPIDIDNVISQFSESYNRALLKIRLKIQ